MTASAPSNPDAHPWWPALFLVPTLAAIAIAAWGSSEATTYVLENPCITGWDVPWAVPFTVVHSLGLLGAIAAVAIAFARRSGSRTRAIALICLAVGVMLWLYAAGLISAPYGWHCDRL